MSGFSDIYENQILDRVFNGVAGTWPAAWFIKLHTGDPGEAGTANAATETTRQAVSDWTAASGGVVSNVAEVVWTAVAATESITHFSIWTLVTGGVCIMTGALSATASAISGADLRAAAGAIICSQN